MTTSYLGPCSVTDPEPCTGLATRQTIHGPMCDSHRKRLTPGRAGKTALFAPILEQLDPRDRLRSAATEYAEASAEDDLEYRRADDRLRWAARQYAMALLADERRQKAMRLRRAIRKGLAKARAEGKRVGGLPKLDPVVAERAVHEHGGVRAAARALGVDPKSVRRALRRVPSPPPHGALHALAPGIGPLKDGG